MRICACEQVSVKREGGGRREEKRQVEQYARASKCQLFHFLKLFLPSILGFSRPNMNRSASPQSKHHGSVVACGNLL